jgi:hypothetical protein
MSDVTLLGCLRLPIEAWDVENYSFVVQQQARCVQAADRIEELENRLAKNHEDYKIQVNAIADKNDKIAELEKQLQFDKRCAKNMLRLSTILEEKLAESIPKSEIKSLDEMWPIFLYWVNDYVGQNTNTFGNVPYSREDMRHAFQAGYELMQEKANND